MFMIIMLIIIAIMLLRGALWFLDEVTKHEQQCDPNWIGFEIIGWIAIISAIIGSVYWFFS